MSTFYIGLLLLLVLYFAAAAFVKADVRKLARQLKFAAGMTLMGAAFLLTVTGRWALALPLGAFGLSILMRGGVGALSSGFSPSGPSSSGQRSRVRSAIIEMELDHASGDMQGRVLAGRFEGRALGELSIGDLMALYAECRRDGESLALLEAYLDRREPTWRENAEAHATDGQRRAAHTGAMTHEEAYEILGLSAGASETEIRTAHRRLMASVHPDKGGSTYLAAKINEAKDLLLG